VNSARPTKGERGDDHVVRYALAVEQTARQDALNARVVAQPEPSTFASVLDQPAIIGSTLRSLRSQMDEPITGIGKLHVQLAA